LWPPFLLSELLPTPWQAVSDAVEAFSHAMGYVVAVRQLSEGEQVPSAKLKAYAGRLVARMEQVRPQLISNKDSREFN
jgi:hypothetical protein